ncbi:MAG: LuxR C-terminal-related transcriptional regulator [Acidimicrobiales bacterium]
MTQAGQTDAPRVWVDDQNSIFRRGLVSCLAGEGLQIAGESTSLRPSPDLSGVDVLLFQVDRGGLARALALRRTYPVLLVAVVASPDDPLALELIERGIGAVLFRNELNPQALVAAIRSVVSGSSALPVELVPRLLDRAARSGNGGPHPLTSRELAVLRSLSEGDDTREIADTLGYSVRTVKNIVHDLLMKTNCRNRAHAVALATRQGLI